MYVARQFLLAVFIPQLIGAMVARQGLEYRVPDLAPAFSPLAVGVAAAFLLPALLIDGVRWAARRRGTGEAGWAFVAGAAAAPPLVALGAWLNSFVALHAGRLGFPPEILLPPTPPAAAVWLALPLAMLAGALGGGLGSGLGAILRLNQR
jgi:hypothetical protein